MATAGLLSGLEGCAGSAAIVKAKSSNGLIEIPISTLDATKNYFIVREPELEYDVLLMRSTNQTYQAFYMQCTHENNPVYFNGSQLYCNAHGSRFDPANGAVLQGPAASPLRKFNVQVNANSVAIQLS